MQTGVQLNPDVIPWNAGERYDLTFYDAGGQVRQGEMLRGAFNVKVPAKGLVAIRIHGLRVETAFQRRVAAMTALKTTEQGFARLETGAPALGKVTGMLINVAPEFADAYIYSGATEKQARRMRLVYRIADGEWQQTDDNAYPFEFSVHLPDATRAFEFRVEAEDAAGKWASSETRTLRR